MFLSHQHILICDKKEIVLNDYNIISPVKLSSGTYSGNIWYGSDRDNIFSGPNVWGAQYPFKNNRIKISQFAGNIKNKSFLATIEYNFLYKGNKYFAQIVGPENGYYKYSPKDKSYTTERLDGKIVNDERIEVKTETSKIVQEKEKVNPEKQLEKEREKNQELGLGYFSDEEITQQKQKNLQLGKGEITDAQYDAECEKNENDGEGHFSDYELQTQRENNEKKGKGLVTDSEVQKINKKLYAEKVKPLVDKAKKYESEKRWCFALGAYYDALAVDVDPEVKLEVYDRYKELKTVILSGNPGIGKYNVFTIHDEWKKLLIDAEKYGSSINTYELIIGDLVQGDLNYETRTATYSASVEKKISDRYEKTVDIIQIGYSNAYKDDWSSDLPKPKDWPMNSVSSNKDDTYNVNGALIFVVEQKDKYGNIYKNFRNAFAVDTTLYDYKFNIVDESGNEVVKSKRFLLGIEKSIKFEGLSLEVMDLIDNGKAFINPVAVYLEYGKYNPSDDKGGRTFIKNFSEVTLNLDNAVFYGKNQKEDFKRKSFKDMINYDFVLVKNYVISKTEVTQDLYEYVMGENPSYFKGEDNPVENVSWYDAIYFCNKLSERNGKTPVYSVNGKTDVNTWEYKPHNESSIHGNIEQNLSADGYRLPTQEEWEYAAKGGKYYKYSGSDNLDEVGWYKDNSGYMTHPVAQKKTNEYGLYDMSGNVWEWCWDVAPHDSNYRYSCGGSYSGYDNHCKVDSLYSDCANYQTGNVGFRIVCSASN